MCIRILEKRRRNGYFGMDIRDKCGIMEPL